MLHLPRRTWPAFWLFLLACATLHAQQVEARFKLPKTDYLVHEPIFVTFEIENSGPKPVGVFHSSPYGCMSYDFRVNPPAINWYSCDNTVGSCLGSIRVIAPGERLQQEILLQYWIRLEQPGVYEISSLGRIYQDTPNPDPDAPRERPPDVRANLTVSIHSPESPPQMSMLYRPVLENLNSKEEEKRTNAARIINEVAPPFLQPTILEMAKDPTKQYFALNGLRKLNSPESRAVLADWAAGFRNTFSSTQEIAIRYLGKMGDRSHMPLLLRLAKQSENDYLSSQALNAYAQLGRDEAIPELLRILMMFSE